MHGSELRMVSFAVCLSNKKAALLTCKVKNKMQVVQVAATGESNAVDATGAGDLFASGFLYGLVKGLPLEECCKVGACSGGSVVRALGGEVRPENWQWMYKQMNASGLLLPDLKN